MERSFFGYLMERVPPRRDVLTAAQCETLRYLSHGLTEPMIAEARGVSLYTVKDHTSHARQRLAAKNTTHAVALALRLGLID